MAVGLESRATMAFVRLSSTNRWASGRRESPDPWSMWGQIPLQASTLSRSNVQYRLSAPASSDPPLHGETKRDMARGGVWKRRWTWRWTWTWRVAASAERVTGG